MTAATREFLESDTTGDRNHAPEGPGQDYALIIGVNDYPKLRTLRGAVADAQAFAEWLVSREGGRVPAANLRTILSTPNPLAPIGHEINDALEEILERANGTGGRRFYFYFSGHGCVGDRASDISLCLANWSELRRRAALSSDAWLNVVVRSGAFAEVAFFLDCCRVWAVRAVGLPPHIDFARPVERDEPTRVFLAYATEFQRAAVERSFEASEGVRGIFTRALVGGLSGNAAAWNDVVTADALKRYLEDRVFQESKAHGFHQRAEVLNGFASAAAFGPVMSSTEQLRISLMFTNQLNTAGQSEPTRNPGSTRIHDVPSFSVAITSAGGHHQWRLPHPLAAWLPSYGSRSYVGAASWLNPMPEVTAVVANTVDESSRLLVVFLDRMESQPTVPLSVGWSLWRGDLLVELNRKSAWNLDECDWSMFSVHLDPGTYTLRWVGKREFSIQLYPGFTTQIVVDHEHWTPKFEGVRVFLVAGAQHPHEPPIASVADAVERGLTLLGSESEDIPLQNIPRPFRDIMAGAAFNDPMIGLLAAYLLARTVVPNHKYIEAIANRVEVTIGPCPDIHALRLRAALLRGFDIPTEHCAEPPTFRDGLMAFVEASHQVPEIIVPGSLLEHACVHRLVDSPLSSWPSQKYAVTNGSDWLIVAIDDITAECLEMGKPIDTRAIAKELGVPTLAVHARLREARNNSIQSVQDEARATNEIEMNARMTARDFEGALALVENILAIDPENRKARRNALLCRKSLDIPTYLVPRMVVSPEALATMMLDDNTLRLIDTVDGELPIEDVIQAYVSYPDDYRFALSKLHDLVLHGIIEIVRFTAEPI